MCVFLVYNKILKGNYIRNILVEKLYNLRNGFDDCATVRLSLQILHVT